MNEVKYPNVTVELTGRDGNAMTLMASTARELRRAGVSKDEIDEFYAEATSGDYDHVLTTIMKWVNVE